MKKVILLILNILALQFCINAQDYQQQMEATVAKLDQAKAVRDYQLLSNDFSRIAQGNQNQWLPYYYAAFCNAKIGWLSQDNPERIEPFANQAEDQIQKALSLVDTAAQKEITSEIYCVMSMINKARVFVNPQTQGGKYGPVAFQYAQKARSLNHHNPRALYLNAWDKYHTPLAFGGDKKIAKALLEKAMIQLEHESTTGLKPHWGKVECEVILKKYK
jgi:hypothetical protein